ncbi:hypothetical protein VE01_04770 [Pseudogymnoascus verrucosus]|uniref:Uncharacterized protein n=1 Tax=Pseudogymnoascus verrucosus TaxID=342668 RepID=A0A1B8GN79_9PEZI|nr:uncharacterized protein VE01_04770 [Pseudogymnoascus verrucosus]OBT97248.1 hypothetical protein VE01_04770 [Pseudogymnoascus verrucosus]
MVAPTGVPKQPAAILAMRDMTFTKAPLYKRTDECPQNYALCPSSLSGGCCPSDHSCGTSSCYATTPTPLSICTQLGYQECRLVDGGGCCLPGYACASNSCIPTTSSTISTPCDASSTHCPAAFGGCCHSTYACGQGYCYATALSTVKVTVVTTKTDSKGHVATVNTVISTAYMPSTQPTLGPSPVATAAVPRFTPTTIPIAKVASTPSSSSGLSKGALAGIVVGVVVILIAIIATGWCVLRRINAVAKQSEGHRTSGSGSNRTPMSKNRGPNGGNSGAPGSGPTNVDFDNMSIDPLMMTSSGAATPHLSRPTPTHNSSYDTQITQAPAISPPIPSPYASPPLGNTQGGGYQAVPLGDAQYFDTRHHSGQGSPSNISPYSPGYPTSASWGEPVPDPAIRDQNLRFGRISNPSPGGNRHWSQISDVSALSAGSGPGIGIAELDQRSGLVEMSEQESSAAAGVVAGSSAANRSSVDSHKKTKSFEFIAHRRKRSSAGSGMSQLLTPPLPGGQSPILENEAAETEAEVGAGAEWERRHRATRSEEAGESGQIVYAHQAERNSLPTPVVARGGGVGDGGLPSPVGGVSRKPVGGGGV